ncbi:MAG TPA: class II fumarate hydratase [Pseudonocardia sp.]|uniref:class II fumarate hydratase n=1 Tax=Pseudonocardia sp. TaxID=60912 RepID=UPI002CFD975E|nr:class II fumarate hydratase [Pseudonocardia sp.]HTF52094.1 class II fumarate hydratase [Pseudonocardia sp.]
MTTVDASIARPTRTERDFGGEIEVPASVLYGAQTQRAAEAFTVSDLRLPRQYIARLGALKRAAARVNQELGLISPEIADAVIRAAGEVADGRLDEHFVVDLFQTGSGTNTNMNANEVIANRANQLLGHPLGGKYPVHPNDHVNKGQSSNDTTPTTIHLAAQVAITHRLLPALARLLDALRAKAVELDDVVKTGRTHLQDAVPIRLGQEFAGYAGQIERGIARIRPAQDGLAEVALGGTAIGTGINTHPEFASRVCALLSDEFGVALRETDSHFQAQSTLDAAVHASGALKTVAVSLLKIANDIRWMNSGPRAGLREIELPTLSMGSSIMPGKTNPILAEAVCQVAAKVIGNDTTIILGGQHGSFEINVMMPVVAYSLLESIDLLAGVSRVFADGCVDGVTATAAGPAGVESGLMMATALSPRIGHDRAAAVAARARELDRTVRDVARLETDLTEDELDQLLDARRLTGR